ncbi:LEAF RUST 10 DISEASE-RESISTANCE LOCUS RECEPTOR-LIKE PROTEIN KINASE-like 1.1 [Capsicum chacoense]
MLALIWIFFFYSKSLQQNSKSTYRKLNQITWLILQKETLTLNITLFHFSCFARPYRVHNMSSTFLFLCCLVMFSLHQVLGNSITNCTDEFDCGSLGVMKFPFTNSSNPECGLCKFDCHAKPYPKIELGGHKYDALLKKGDFFLLSDPMLKEYLDNKSCKSFNKKFSFPNSPLMTFQMVPNLTLYRCKHSQDNTIQKTIDYFFQGFNSYKRCEDFNVYYHHPKNSLGNTSAKISGKLPKHCSLLQLPIVLPTPSKPYASHGLFELLTSDILLDWELSKDCHLCLDKGGKCQIIDEHEFHCSKGLNGQSKLRMIILASVISGVGLILLSSVVIFSIWRRKRGKNDSKQVRQDLVVESKYFGFQVPVFTYAELQEATNNFDPSNELGDGGFGTVYSGKLYDGREVAVKCLYEHNCKRMQQFINEIEILTRLRHQNLVSLYGCTSRRSRELLLVYEYIPNGTVADHLHGERAAEGSLTWPIRMNIAVETASALAYLHASDVIHRDVKTNNILLGNNFRVKVADFGLSRLFPNDVTHISTAPQGTLGYVDPEYHECYQLTDKSDVYSFGVVLIELVSSMPAVDMNRHKHEINLANLAINRIQRCAFDELIDPSVEFAPDILINKRMTISVAKLAFRCLQPDRDIRPTMDEVLNILKNIQGGKFHQDEKTFDTSASFNLFKNKSVNIPPFSPESDKAALLQKVRFLSSPETNSEIWISGSTTTSTSE